MTALSPFGPRTVPVSCRERETAFLPSSEAQESWVAPPRLGFGFCDQGFAGEL